MKDIVFDICERMLRNSPKRSFSRLNPALRSTLANCIEADLPFQLETFQRIYSELRGHYWFGDGAGSSVGERFYTFACGVNHASAQQSFENFAERPACLWEENAKTPERLYVDAQFTWRGHYATVTSMRKDSLVACTYKDYRPRVEGLKLGATLGYNPEYVITSSKKDGAATLCRLVKAKKTEGDRDIAKRFVISYSDIATYRREAKAKLKVMLEKIAKCDPETEAATITAAVNAAHFRHWELEDVRAAFLKRKDWINQSRTLEDWRRGKGEAWIDIKAIAIRVREDLVECSNGNSVNKAECARALPVLLANRNKSMSLDYPLGAYLINSVKPTGVEVGCTLVPWEEIDLITPALTL